MFGGAEVKSSEDFPYQVSIGYKNGHHFCGGALISDLHVLTAAHCIVYDFNITSLRSIRVLVGSNRLGEGLPYDIKRMSYHKDFSIEENEKLFNNDIAIIQVSRLIFFNSKLLQKNADFFFLCSIFLIRKIISF